MVINHNISSIFATRQVNKVSEDNQKAMEKLSSGDAISHAANNASGLAVSEKMRAQIRGLNQASKNISDGVSFIQTTEGYLDEITQIIHRIRELSVQSVNGIYSDEDRMQIQVEVSQLIAEVDRIASQSTFNGMTLLTGRFSKENSNMVLQVGANIDQNISVYIEEVTAMSLGLKPSTEEVLNIRNPEDANRAIGTLDEALKKINSQRANLGAYQKRLELAKNGVDIAYENMQSAESKIRDTDFAKEMTEYVKNNILNQSSIAMLANANSQAEAVLSLLK